MSHSRYTPAFLKLRLAWYTILVLFAPFGMQIFKIVVMISNLSRRGIFHSPSEFFLSERLS
jgi:hypothetical protein